MRSVLVGWARRPTATSGPGVRRSLSGESEAPAAGAAASDGLLDPDLLGGCLDRHLGGEVGGEQAGGDGGLLGAAPGGQTLGEVAHLVISC